MRIEYPKRISLAKLPTPIEPLERLSRELGGPEVWVKRDDLTESAASGNKIRKLEFAMAEAQEQGADTLITCGWSHSNHARATAIVAAKLGLKSVLLLRGPKPDRCQGNLFLDRLVGAEIQFLTPEEYDRRDELMDQIAQKLKDGGNIAYPIPSGATNEIGIWGYIKAAEEIKEQLDGMDLEIDALIVPVGTGGTLAGLLIGRALCGLETAVYGVNVDADAEYFRKSIRELIHRWQSRYGIDITIPEEDINLIDGYVGRGYGLSQPEERRTITRVAELEGIILDPVYTGKAMHGLLGEIKRGRFRKGQRVLFIHTGGIFGLMGASEEWRFT
jgi:D-cysteine desulfhydrase